MFTCTIKKQLQSIIFRHPCDKSLLKHYICCLWEAVIYFVISVCVFLNIVSILGFIWLHSLCDSKSMTDDNLYVSQKCSDSKLQTPYKKLDAFWCMKLSSIIIIQTFILLWQQYTTKLEWPEVGLFLIFQKTLQHNKLVFDIHSSLTIVSWHLANIKAFPYLFSFYIVKSTKMT